MKKVIVAIVASILSLMLSSKVFAQPLVADAGNDTLICAGNTVVLGGNPSASGGTGNYTYSWTPATGLSLANIANPTAGPITNTSYILAITDGVDTAYDTVLVSVLPLPTVDAGPDISICQGSCVYLIATGGISYIWNTGEIMPNNTVCPVTTTIYSVTATNANGCTASDSITVIVAPPLGAVITATADSCGTNGGVICATAFGGVPPYMYVWNVIPMQSQPCVSNLPAGNYVLTITDSYGCSASSAGTVLYVSGPTITFNNIIDADCGMSNGSASSVVSGGTGPYTYIWNTQPPQTTPDLVNVQAGLYTLTITSANGCSAVNSVNISYINCPNAITGKVFFDTNTDGIQNNGELACVNTLVKLLPLNYYQYTDVNGNYELPCGIGSFDILLPNKPLYYISNPDTINVVFTTTGIIDSLNNFALHQLTNVKELEITATPYAAPRPGFNSTFNITYKNNGTMAMSGTVEFVFDNNYSFASANPVQTGIAANTATWGFTNLLPGSSCSITVNLVLSTSTLIGTNLTSVANIFPIVNDTIPINNTDSTLEVVVGSFDPNDKSVDPPEELPESFYNDDLPLTYTIRFQNTGTAEAYNIYVSDTLSANLNIETFEMLAASHPYTMQLSNNNVLTWTFANIMLPDSNANEPQSHGFIKYSIKPLQTLGDVDSIKNTAYIYFDFNAAVVTNTVNSYLGSSVDIRELTAENNIKVFPNPVNEMATFDLTAIDCSQGKLQIYDELSKLVYTSEFKSALVNADCSEWKNGFYFYLIKNTKGQVIGKGKFVVH